jgi:hypothetical protein
MAACTPILQFVQKKGVIKMLGRRVLLICSGRALTDWALELKSAGFSVLPILKITEARTLITGGRFDIVLVMDQYENEGFEAVWKAASANGVPLLVAYSSPEQSIETTNSEFQTCTIHSVSDLTKIISEILDTRSERKPKTDKPDSFKKGAG